MIASEQMGLLPGNNDAKTGTNIITSCVLTRSKVTLVTIVNANA